MTSTDRPALRPHAYVLAVHDIAGSAAYFADVLGFTVEWSTATTGGRWCGTKYG